ncbi:MULTISPECIES: DNA-formamidopyrimidine glycosylase family protein [unclassified Pseudomonas]|uniref:DNA-formamidopyrimidine glycosylase family protein n=1 Tax=unclassified Pseudomonas TaxID=196821 RepID=UPI002449BB3E|nr:MULTISPECIES: DNA-formamidopyrimidine glycosylase family protein [unclassified Pseudomonas]MDG9921969.1 endonuclease [Pseudomonas sp. GD04045]MDH0033938.1 endonuclease [Pseudomonas sp. GD04019]
MPEGPSILILREETERFAGQRILRVEGNSKVDLQRLHGQRVKALRSWGKHFLIELEDVAVRIHLLLFGSYRIDERKDAAPRLSLGFANGELNFYGCSVQLLQTPLSQHYDWRCDTLADEWDAELALAKLQTMPATLACDAILDQQVFAGAGNIFKNEVLFRIQVHPLSPLGALPVDKLRELVSEVRQYAFDFLAWKKAFVLKQHWQVHRQSRCPRCAIPLSKAKLGRTQRQSYYCEQCQLRYG